MTSNGKLVNVCFNSSTQRLMVKTTQKSDLPWSAIFSVIVYKQPVFSLHDDGCYNEEDFVS